MPFSSSHYAADAYVTASNPAPGRELEFEFPVKSGTGWTTGTSVRYDGGIGLNVYVAGGTGASGSVGTILRDQTGAFIVVTNDGNRSLSVSDEALSNVLGHILTELKKINVQLASMTGEEIQKSEVE